MIKLKVKAAKILRRWAEKLSPVFPYDAIHIPYQKEETCDIQKVMMQHAIPRYVYERDPDRMNRLAREEIIVGIAKEMNNRNIIKITIEPHIDKVVYIGEITTICSHD